MYFNLYPHNFTLYITMHCTGLLLCIVTTTSKPETRRPMCKQVTFGNPISETSISVRPSFCCCSSVTLRPPLLDSKTGWLQSSGQKLISFDSKTKGKVFFLLLLWFFLSFFFFRFLQKFKLFGICIFCIIKT